MFYHHQKGVIIPFFIKNFKFFALAAAGLFVFSILSVVLKPADAANDDILNTFTQSELDTNWEADRQYPSDDVTSVSAFGRTNVARIGVDSTETATGTFQRTEGIKTVGAGNFGDKVQVDLYLDPAWEDTATRAGLWVVGDNGSGARDNWFGILEFVNNEPCSEPDCTNTANITDHEGFRIWDSSIGWKEDLSTSFTYGDWVTLEIDLDVNAETYTYFIDGVEVGTATAGSHFIREVFLNSYNYGEDNFPTLNSENYAAHWHTGFPTTPGASYEVVMADTAIAENEPGWLFNRDTNTDTPFEFNTDQASIGSGSLYVLPITNTEDGNDDKFIAEYFLLEDIDEVDSVSYDFYIGSGGDASDANEFYLNVYANYGESDPTKYYDCKYDVVPTTGSTSGWTTVTFDPTQSYPVTTRGSSPYACPSIPADMDTQSPGSSIRMFAINLGDTSASDQDLDGYFDNVIVSTETEVKSFDFEPDTTPPAQVEGMTIFQNGDEIGCDAVVNERAITVDWNDSEADDFDHYVYQADDGVGTIDFETTTTQSERSGNIRDLDGTYQYRVAAVDSNGNQGDFSEWCMVTLDRVAPTTPEIIHPVDEQYFNDTPILNDWTDSTDTNGIDRYQIAYYYDDGHTFGGSTCPGLELDGNPVSGCRDTSNSQRNHTPALSEQGGVTIWVRAFDNAGNASDWSESVHYYYDETPPAVPANLKLFESDSDEIPNGGITNSYSVLASWDAVGDADHYEYRYWNSIPGDAYNAPNYYVTNPSGTTQSGVFNRGEGMHHIQVRAVDEAGNKSDWTDQFDVIYDSTAPAVEVTTHEDDDIVVGTIGIAGIVTDDNPSHYWFVLQNNSGTTIAGPGVVSDSNSPANPSFSFDTTTVPDGTYLIKLEARDAAGNKAPDEAPVLSDPEEEGDSVDWVRIYIDNDQESEQTDVNGVFLTCTTDQNSETGDAGVIGNTNGSSATSGDSTNENDCHFVVNINNGDDENGSVAGATDDRTDDDEEGDQKEESGELNNAGVLGASDEDDGDVLAATGTQIWLGSTLGVLIIILSAALRFVPLRRR